MKTLYTLVDDEGVIIRVTDAYPRAVILQEAFSQIGINLEINTLWNTI